MCRIQGCNRPALNQCATWGLAPNAVCITCYQDTIKDILERAPTLTQEYAQDYAKIYLLLEDTAHCQTYLLQLNQRLALGIVPLEQAAEKQKHDDKLAAKAQGPDNLYIKLSMAMERFEQKCWFPTAHLIPLGLLSTKDFLSLVRLGYVLKDYGAGIAHGEFTHRIQWHIIMSAITNGFTDPKPSARGWSKTPLDLFTSLGKPEAARLWGYLLDTGGNAQSYRYPDTLHKDLINSVNVPILTHNLSRRERKRREEFIDEYKDRAIAKGADLSGLADPTNLNTYNTYVSAVAGKMGDVYNAKYEDNAAKMGDTNAYRNFVRGPYNEAGKAIAKDYKTTKKGVYKGDPLLAGGVQKLSGEQVIDKDQIDARVRASYTGFWTNFSGP